MNADKTAMRETKMPQSPFRRMHRISEVAKILDASERWVRDKIKAGDLRCFRSGRFLRVPADALDEFIERGRRA
jgi:excisionase family DNA binding protein